MSTDGNFERRCIDTIRFMSVDAIENAKSGHPGMPMGAAGMAYVLWTGYLKHNPTDPEWIDRDRFILSAGHASSLLYVMFHLSGYDLPLTEIKAFRKWGSKTPGHPESTVTPGVEVTTGPLGQGIATAVGEAIAEAHLAACYNRPGYEMIDHYTYALVSDGDLMEGVSAEACAIAGHLALGKLIVLYDANNVSLAGSTSLCFTEDIGKRFEAQGWHIEFVDNGQSIDVLGKALDAAKSETGRPSLIVVNTVIGDGAPSKEGSYNVHGSPLGTEELIAAKQKANWPVEPMFHVPQDVLDFFRKAIDRGRKWQARWQELLSGYAAEYPDLWAELDRRMTGELPSNWDESLPEFPPDEVGLPTRRASEAVLQTMAASIPELAGGSADLNPCTYTWLKGYGDFQSPSRNPNGIQGTVGGVYGYAGRNIHYGVREHAMGAIANGMASHGGFLPYTATFLTFSDYMRAPIRIAALSKSRVVFVFTHDSIAVGEDGPTHQPIEHLMNLRAIPNMIVIRPADANEVRVAWKVAIANEQGPTALIFTRQAVATLDRSDCFSEKGLVKGGYVLWESCQHTPELILIATGSEVHLALEAGKKLACDGIAVRVVSLPSWELFDQQSAEYRESVLPDRVRARVAVEAGTATGWEHYVGLDGITIGMEGFGASAPGPVVYQRFGFTKENVVTKARKLLGKQHGRKITHS
jgi:transketolase